MQYFLVWGYIFGIFDSLPSRMSFPYLVMLSKLGWFTRGVVMVGYFSDILLCCLIYPI